MVSESNYIFTSESVSEGHPDKICDQISDTVLDLYLSADPQSRVACETLTTTNRVVLAGEVRGPDSVTPQQIEQAVRETVRGIGYEQDGFHWKQLRIDNFLHAQSDDIAMGVDSSADKEEGAGDQGIMFGYACRQTDALMPAAIYYAHRILRLIADCRRSKHVQGLGPDAKSQVSLLYQNGQPVKATGVVVSTQHDADLDQAAVTAMVRPLVEECLPDDWMCPEECFFVNPTGRFVIGGPDGDAGLTGRKIIVDTYGGAAPHGGGAFSGKDPTKVDRSGAYAARYLAKNVVAAGLADSCIIQLAYAIGVARPVAVYIKTHGDPRVDATRLSATLQDMVDLSPSGIRLRLGLNRPIYARTAAYGHFGRSPESDGGFSWEKTDLATDLRSAFA